MNNARAMLRESSVIFFDAEGTLFSHSTSMSRLPAESEIDEGFPRRTTRALAEGAISFVRQLRLLGKKTGILSNYSDALFGIVRELEIEALFDWIFPASILGYQKPSLQCFREVERRTEHTRDTLLYIGDSFENDYMGALNAGWKGILFTQRPRTGVTSTSSFGELLDLL
jgi:FMN phosphatase YigB (HAD superfamily)